MVKFDPTINIGTLFSLIAVVLVIFRAYTAIASRLDRLETRMDPVWKWFLSELNEMRMTNVGFERQPPHGRNDGL